MLSFYVTTKEVAVSDRYIYIYIYNIYIYIYIYKQADFRGCWLSFLLFCCREIISCLLPLQKSNWQYIKAVFLGETQKEKNLYFLPFC